MYIPAWPSLNPAFFFKSESIGALPYPLNAKSSNYFYVARNGIYHLFRALGFDKGRVVLVPDYHHGNEIYAIRAAGASVQYYPVKKNFDLDLNEVERLCCRHKPRALYITHFIGFSQPMAELKALCRDKGIMLIEDCALSFLSTYCDQPLGTFGDYSVFCLYKTLPLPNGGVLVQNNQTTESLDEVKLQPCNSLSVAARSVELMLQWLRMRYELPGCALFAVKRFAGRALKASQVRRVPVGNTGFDLSAVNIAMSAMCNNLIRRFQYERIKEIRRRNFQSLADRVRQAGGVLPRGLDDGACPLFFPLLVEDKESASRALWSGGVETVQFWNHGDPEARRDGSAAVFLREHLLEIPIHQDVNSRQVERIGDQVMKVKLCRA